MKVEIYGASDDLIELEGDISEEFYGGDDPKYLTFSDGTVIAAIYCPTNYEGWKIERVAEGTATFKVSLEGDFTLVGCFDEPDGPSHDWLVRWFEDFDAEDFSQDQLLAAFNIFCEREST